jgi:hypothetical protein
VDQGLVAADRGSGAGLDASPAELVSDMLVALLDPVPDPVQPDHLGEVGLFLELAGVSCRPPGRAVWWPGTSCLCRARSAGRWWRPRAGCARRVPTSPVGRRWSTRSRCARRGTGAVPGSSRRGRRACPRTRPGRRRSGVPRVSWGTATPGIRLGVQRVVDTFVGPHSGHGDAAVVGLGVAAQPLPPGVRGAGAVLAVPGIVDDQHTAVVRCGGRIAEE